MVMVCENRYILINEIDAHWLLLIIIIIMCVRRVHYIGDENLMCFIFYDTYTFIDGTSVIHSARVNIYQKYKLSIKAKTVK